MSSINESLILNTLNMDVYRESEALAPFWRTNVHTRMHRGILYRLRTSTLPSNHLQGAKEAC